MEQSPTSLQLLAKNVREYRETLNLSQQDLADLLGLTSITISNIERGQNWPKPATFDKLAQILKVSPYELLLDREHDELESKSRLLHKVNTFIQEMQDYQEELEKGSSPNHPYTRYTIKHPIKSKKK